LGPALLKALLKHSMHLWTNGFAVGRICLFKESEKVEAVPKIEMVEVEKVNRVEETGKTEEIGEPELEDESERPSGVRGIVALCE
jgi:hypothetical protein